MTARPNTPRRFGAYYYGWYDAAKWRGHQHPFVPLIGFYDALDPLAIDWQVDAIQRAGLDYVIFEVVPPGDHSSARCLAHIEACLPRLAKAGIGYSFLFDLFVIGDAADPVATYREVIADFRARGWLDGLYGFGERGPRVFAFAPYPAYVPGLRAATPAGLELHPTLWNPTWGRLADKSIAPRVAEMLKRHWDLPALHRGEPYAEAVAPLGFVQFWQHASETRALNGFAAVAPGYDDLLLNRDPQLAQGFPRDDGRALVQQMRAAIASGATDITIYSWNEYFEATVIEPTTQHGDFYLELMCALIAQARAGEPIAMPAGLAPPAAVPPVYLSPALRTSGEGHADGVPRWDEDDFVARLSGPAALRVGRTTARLTSISITNAGLRPWPLGHDTPIRLGLRLLDTAGAVLRESRSDLASTDLPPGGSMVRDIEIDLSNLPSGKYEASVGVVWDGRMWMPDTITVPLELEADPL